MSEKRIFIDSLNDILDEINRIFKFVGKMTYAEFTKDEKTIYAVTRSLEIVGEATKNIPDNIKNNYCQIPWSKISGMRNKLIHEYFGVDLETLWNTIKNRLPEIKEPVEEILNSFNTKKITVTLFLVQNLNWLAREDSNQSNLLNNYYLIKS